MRSLLYSHLSLWLSFHMLTMTFSASDVAAQERALSFQGLYFFSLIQFIHLGSAFYVSCIITN